MFSDRVAYPVYFSMPRQFGFSVLEDQQCAAALMWTCVTLVYLVPAAILSIAAALAAEFLTAAIWRNRNCAAMASQRDSQSLEAV